MSTYTNLQVEWGLSFIETKSIVLKDFLVSEKRLCRMVICYISSIITYHHPHINTINTCTFLSLFWSNYLIKTCLENIKYWCQQIIKTIWKQPVALCHLHPCLCPSFGKLQNTIDWKLRCVALMHFIYYLWNFHEIWIISSTKWNIVI
jgi:hypothetical protein